SIDPVNSSGADSSALLSLRESDRRPEARLGMTRSSGHIQGVCSVVVPAVTLSLNLQSPCPRGRTVPKIQRAILSVTDKSGIIDFAKKLAGMNVELFSTGGTAKLLRDSGVAVKDISELTGFPEMMDGRVKTLHPKVHGGILHVRSNAEHVAAAREHGIQPIDMVVVNLYAFEKTAAKPGVGF